MERGNPLPKGEGAAKRRVRGADSKSLHPSSGPSGHLLPSGERFAPFSPISRDAVVFPEFGKQGNADQDASQADHASGHNRESFSRRKKVGHQEMAGPDEG